MFSLKCNTNNTPTTKQKIRIVQTKNVILDSVVVGGSGEDSGVSVTMTAVHLGEHEK